MRRYLILHEGGESIEKVDGDGVLYSDHLARVTELEQENTALQQRLAALDWQKITPENLPKVGDEVGVFEEGRSVIYEVTSMHALFTSSKWQEERGMTHYRPIGAPHE